MEQAQFTYELALQRELESIAPVDDPRRGLEHAPRTRIRRGSHWGGPLSEQSLRTKKANREDER